MARNAFFNGIYFNYTAYNSYFSNFLLDFKDLIVQIEDSLSLEAIQQFQDQIAALDDMVFEITKDVTTILTVNPSIEKVFTMPNDEGVFFFDDDFIIPTVYDEYTIGLLDDMRLDMDKHMFENVMTTLDMVTDAFIYLETNLPVIDAVIKEVTIPTDESLLVDLIRTFDLTAVRNETVQVDDNVTAVMDMVLDELLTVAPTLAKDLTKALSAELTILDEYFPVFTRPLTEEASVLDTHRKTFTKHHTEALIVSAEESFIQTLPLDEVVDATSAIFNVFTKAHGETVNVSDDLVTILDQFLEELLTIDSPIVKEFDAGTLNEVTTLVDWDRKTFTKQLELRKKGAAGPGLAVGVNAEMFQEHVKTLFDELTVEDDLRWVLDQVLTVPLVIDPSLRFDMDMVLDETGTIEDALRQVWDMSLDEALTGIDSYRNVIGKNVTVPVDILIEREFDLTTVLYETSTFAESFYTENGLLISEVLNVLDTHGLDILTRQYDAVDIEDDDSKVYTKFTDLKRKYSPGPGLSFTDDLLGLSIEAVIDETVSLTDSLGKITDRMINEPLSSVITLEKLFTRPLDESLSAVTDHFTEYTLDNMEAVSVDDDEWREITVVINQAVSNDILIQKVFTRSFDEDASMTDDETFEFVIDHGILLGVLLVMEKEVTKGTFNESVAATTDGVKEFTKTGDEPINVVINDTSLFEAIIEDNMDILFTETRLFDLTRTFAEADIATIMELDKVFDKITPYDVTVTPTETFLFEMDTLTEVIGIQLDTSKVFNMGVQNETTAFEELTKKEVSVPHALAMNLADLLQKEYVEETNIELEVDIETTRSVLFDRVVSESLSPAVSNARKEVIKYLEEGMFMELLIGIITVSSTAARLVEEHFKLEVIPTLTNRRYKLQWAGLPQP